MKADVPRPERFEMIALALLEQILHRLEGLDDKVERLDLTVDELDRGLRPYGDGAKVSRRGRRR